MTIRIGTCITALTFAIVAGSAFADPSTSTSTAVDIQRNDNQQERIEQGLKSGELNTKEAGNLERQESRIDRTEARDLKDGTMTPEEQAKLNAKQNHVSKDIYHAKHNDVTGNPNSPSSERMQADVQRNANQQERIDNGVKSGQLTNHETATLERGQAHVNRTEARAAANGRVGAVEQAGIQARENHQSHRTFRKKHNARIQ